MKFRSDIVEKWAGKMVTKIIGQPENESVDMLEKELAAHAAGEHTSVSVYGYLGCIEDDAGYQTRTGAAYARPANPGAYCTSIRATHDEVEIKRRELAHTRRQQEYQTYLAVEDGLRNLIVEAVDEEYLLQLKDEYLGYSQHHAKAMVTHLRDTWCQTTFHERRAFKQELEQEWDTVEHPMLYFQRLDRIRDKISRANGNVDITELIQIAEYSMALMDDKQPSKDWEKKPGVNRTWANLKAPSSRRGIRSRSTSGHRRRAPVTTARQTYRNRSTRKLASTSTISRTPLQPTKNTSSSSPAPTTRWCKRTDSTPISFGRQWKSPKRIR